MPIFLKLDKHLNNFGYYLLEGYHLFLTVLRNVGSVNSAFEIRRVLGSNTRESCHGPVTFLGYGSA